MKYIFIILICFLGLTSTAQVQKQPRSNFPTVVDSSLAIGKNFILPVFRSFSQLATYNVLDSSGRLVFIRDSNAVFYRNNQHAWVKLSSSGGSDLDAWLLEGNSPNAGSFIGTTFGAIDLVLRSNGLKMAEFLGTDRIVRLGVLDTTIGGNTYFEIDDTDASSTDLFTGLYKYSKLGQEWGGIYNTYMPSTQGVGNLYNPGNGFLTWNIPGSSGTFPGIDSFTISPPPPSLTTSVGYWIDGAPIFYPLAGDSSKVINDTLFQYFGGDSIPYPVVGNRIFFGDTATVSGDIFCSIKNGNDSCILINNNGIFVDSIGLNSDSSQYVYFNNDTELGTFPTLIQNLIGVGRIIARDTTGGVALYWDSTGFVSVPTLRQVIDNVNADNNTTADVNTNGYAAIKNTSDDNGIYIFGFDHPISRGSFLGIYDSTSSLPLSGFIHQTGASQIFGGVSIDKMTTVDSLTINFLEYRNNSNLTMLVQDTVTGKTYRQAIPGGGSTTDSVQIGNDWFYTTKITLTPAEVYTLNSVPVDAVAAPGAGFAYSIIKASIRQDYNTTDYNDAVIVFLSINGVNSVSSQNAIIGSSGNIGCSFISTETGLDFTENQPVMITSDTDTSLGDSDIIIYIYYTKITL